MCCKYICMCVTCYTGVFWDMCDMCIFIDTCDSHACVLQRCSCEKKIPLNFNATYMGHILKTLKCFENPLQ